MTEPTLVTADELTSKEGKLTRDLEYAEKSQQHFWIALLTHRLTDEEVAKIAGPEDYSPLLGKDSLVNATIGCYLCEQPLSSRLVGKRCKALP